MVCMYLFYVLYIRIWQIVATDPLLIFIKSYWNTAQSFTHMLCGCFPTLWAWWSGWDRDCMATGLKYHPSGPWRNCFWTPAMWYDVRCDAVTGRMNSPYVRGFTLELEGHWGGRPHGSSPDGTINFGWGQTADTPGTTWTPATCGRKRLAWRLLRKTVIFSQGSFGG